MLFILLQEVSSETWRTLAIMGAVLVIAAICFWIAFGNHSKGGDE